MKAKQKNNARWAQRFAGMLAGITALTAISASAADPTLSAPAKKYEFQRDVRSILESSCVGCHDAERHKGEFRLDTREHLLKGSESGPAIVVGKSAESDLIKAVARLEKDTA